MDILTVGNKGDKVILLQKLLQQLGFYKGVLSGEFDMTTLQSVLKYQETNSLPADGVITDTMFNSMQEEATNFQIPNNEPQNYQEHNDVKMASDYTYDLPNLEEPEYPQNDSEIQLEETAPSIPMDPKVSDERRYSVVYGDSLWKLSQRFNTTIEAIKNTNGLTKDSLSIGQILIIPNNI